MESPIENENEDLELSDDDELSEFDSNYIREINELNPKFRIIVEKIAYLISQEGLSIQEACELRNVDFDWFSRQMEVRPIVGRIIRKKELEYKRTLLKSVTKAARDGDDKLALWLLEKRYPAEFGKRSGRPDSGDEDASLLAAAISTIQREGDSNGLVKTTSGKAVIIRRNGSSVAAVDETIKKIQDVLS